MSVAAGGCAGSGQAHAQVGQTRANERAMLDFSLTTRGGAARRARACLPPVLHFYSVCNRSSSGKHGGSIL